MACSQIWAFLRPCENPGTGDGFVDIYRIFVTPDASFVGTKPFDRVDICVHNLSGKSYFGCYLASCEVRQMYGI